MLQEYPAQIQPRSSSTRALYQENNGFSMSREGGRLSEDRTTTTTASLSTSTSAIAVAGTTTATTAEADITDKIDAEAGRILIDLANQNMSAQIIFNDDHVSSSVGNQAGRRKRSAGPPRKASLPIRTDSNYHLQLDRQPPDPIMLLAAAAAVVDDDFNGRYYERREIRLHGRHGAQKRKSYTYGTTASSMLKANKVENCDTKSDHNSNDNNATRTTSPSNYHKEPVRRRQSERRHRNSYTQHNTRRTASFANKQDYTENWVDASTATANISKELEEDLTRAIEMTEPTASTSLQSTVQKNDHDHHFLKDSTKAAAAASAAAETIAPQALIPTPSSNSTLFSYQYLSMKQNPRIKRNAMHAYITYMIYTDMSRSKRQPHLLFTRNDEPKKYTYSIRDESKQAYQPNNAGNGNDSGAGNANIPYWYSPPSSQHQPPYQQHSHSLPPPPTLPATQSYNLPPSPRLSHPTIQHELSSIPAPPLPTSNHSLIPHHTTHPAHKRQQPQPTPVSTSSTIASTSLPPLHQKDNRPLGRPLTDFLFNNNNNSNDPLKSNKKDSLPPPPPPLPVITLPAPNVPNLPSATSSSFLSGNSPALMTSPRPTSTLF